MLHFAREHGLIETVEGLEHIIIIDKELPLQDLPRLYKGNSSYIDR
jgi:hypothetical protein